MKELSIEEKAKRYDEAIKKAKYYYDEGKTLEYAIDIVSDIFPELKESDNERIRRKLLALIEWSKSYAASSITADEAKEMIAWLEKQGEQKLAWSEEDEKFVHGLIRGLTAKRDIHGHTTFSSDCIDITETIDWLKSLKDRVLPQPKQEWSDFDKDILFRTIDSLKFLKDTISKDPKYAVNIIDIEREISWLKSLRPQSQQELSEEDENMLKDIIIDLVHPWNEYIPDRIEYEIKWLKNRLKSIRPQFTLKPSDEKIKVCKEVYADILSAKGFDLGTINGELNRLEEELKKLK